MIKWFQKAQRPAAFENYTLIIPAVSVGNVGQLTVDLVLENARFDDNPVKIAQIFHAGLEPVVANNVVDMRESDTSGGPGRKDQKSGKQRYSTPVVNEEDCLVTACEVYHCPKKQWIVLQFHSAIRKRDREKFVSFLLDWIREGRFQMIVCLSSIFTSERLDANITGLSSRIQVLYTDKIESSYLDKIKSLGWSRLLSPKVLSENPNSKDIGPLKFVEENLTVVNLSGGGITKSLLLGCQSNGIPCLTLMVYASDGENTVDALFLYKEASHLFQFGNPSGKIKIPYIWHQHLGVAAKFGNEDEDVTVVSASARSRQKTYDDPPITIF